MVREEEDAVVPEEVFEAEIVVDEASGDEAEVSESRQVAEEALVIVVEGLIAAVVEDGDLVAGDLVAAAVVADRRTKDSNHISVEMCDLPDHFTASFHDAIVKAMELPVRFQIS